MNITIRNKPVHHDVIIIGGGPAGCAAAIAAARMGADTLVLESSSCLGGMATGGMVSKWAPFTDRKNLIYRSIPVEILTRYKKAAGIDPEKWRWITIHPETLKRVYDEMLAEAGAKVLFGSQVVDAITEDGNIQCVIVANKRGLTPYTADAYIDCSGDADVAAYAGVPFEYGDGNGNVQHSSLCYAIAGADVSKLNGKIISSNPEYNFWQPIIAEGKHPNVTDHFVPAYHGNTIVYCNAGDLIGVDATSPESLSEAYAHGRALAQDFLNALIDYEPEAFGNAVIVATAPIMGARESRRIKGEYTVTVADYIARRDFPDEICRNSYWLDCHDPDPDKGMNTRMYGPGDSHGIPWRSLIPLGVDNLLVAGRCISMERMALSSIRVMPNCLAMGEAAGIGAAIASRNKTGIRAVDAQEVISHIK